MIRAASVTVTLLLGTLLLGVAPDPSPEPIIALVGGTLIDVSNFGQSSQDIKDSVVLIQDNKIVAAGPAASVEIPSGARRIDVSGKYIVPGLMDGFASLANQSWANAYLYMGVTSIVGIEAPPRYPLLFLGANPSPRVYRLDVAGYAEQEDKIVQLSEADTLLQIGALDEQGIKVLLIHYPITPERTAQIVKRARELGMATIGELGLTTYEQGIQAGIPAFVHTGRYSLALAPAKMRLAVANEPFGPPRTEFYTYLTKLKPDDPRLNEYAALLGSSRVGLMPTMSHLYLRMPGHRNPWKEPVAKLIDPKDLHLPAHPETGEPSFPSTGFQSFPAGFAEAIMKIEERYRRAGAKYLAGSGTAGFGTMPGISLHTELELFTRIGLSPRQALAAATSNFGELFGWKGVGQIKPGYTADVLVLNANPLEDIQNLKNIHTVILRGEILDRAKLLERQ